MWHIGHADVAEVLARLSPGQPICAICGRIIEVTRLDKARRNRTRITTCCKRCQLELDARKASPSNPSLFRKGCQKPPPKPHKINGRISPIRPFHKMWV